MHAHTSTQTHVHKPMHIHIHKNTIHVREPVLRFILPDPHPVLPDECPPVYLQALLKPDFEIPSPLHSMCLCYRALFLSRVVLHCPWICMSFAPGWFLHILLKDCSLCCHGGAIFVCLLVFSFRHSNM